MAKFRCLVCGYVHDGDEPPATCPVCNVPAERFERIEEEAGESSWRCTICGYVHVGDVPPELCPICGVDAGLFERVAERETGDSSSFGKVVVIGAGVAGLTAAETICRRTAHAHVTLVSAETEVPYYRLNLTRYLAGEVDRDELTVRSEEWFEQKGINLWLDRRAVKIDRYGRLVHLDNGTTLPYDRLILAMGAQPFVPPIPGTTLSGVSALRTAKDVDAILGATCEGDAVAIVGAGILGLEIAGALNAMKRGVTVISTGDRLMPRQLTRSSSDRLKTHIADLGISLREHAQAQEISSSVGGLTLSFEDGPDMIAKRVVFATGVRPDLALAEEAGLETNRGVIVNDLMRTSDPIVFAAGDLVEHHCVLFGHWYPAQIQGGVAGINATGGNETFDGSSPTAAVKVLGIGVFSVGTFERTGDDVIQVHGDVNGTHYDLVFDNNRLIGANEVGDVTLSATLSHLIDDHVDLSKLLELTHDLDEIIAHLSVKPET